MEKENLFYDPNLFFFKHRLNQYVNYAIRLLG